MDFSPQIIASAHDITFPVTSYHVHALPNRADTAADGQELFVKSVKAPKRYPTTD